MIRPSMFASDSSATNPAAAVAVTCMDVPRKKSEIIGDAFSRMPIPAVTLKQSTTHRHQNCGVLIAFAADTLAVEINLCALLSEWLHPAGSQPSGGTRTSSTPNDMNTAYARPCTRNVSAIAPSATDRTLPDAS